MESAQTKLNKSNSSEKQQREYILELLQAGHNKELKNTMVSWVGDDPKKFDLLFDILFTEEYRLVQRAAWPISYIVKKYPHLVKKHLASVSKTLKTPQTKDAVKRNFLRLLQYLDIPKKYTGKLADACFNFIGDPTEKPAIKAFSITVLDKISKDFPELRTELKLLLEPAMEYESAAFRSRAKKLLHSL